MNDITQEEQNEYLAYHTPNDVISNMSKGLSVEERDIIVKSIGCTLIAGAMIGFDKGISDYLNLWYETCNDLFLLSEVTAENRRYTREKIRFPSICVPHLFAKEMVILGMDIPVTDEMVCFVNERPFLRDARLNFEKRYNGRLGRGYSYAFAYYSFRYLTEIVELLQPSKVILWNEFYSFHIIFKGVLKEHGIPLYYMEFGCIPGTFVIENNGQMGESSIAVGFRRHNILRINSDDIKRAQCVVDYLRESGLNRNEQSDVQFKDLTLRYYNPDRKTILYAGQNDYESGIYPYNEDAKKYHSPYIRSTSDGLEKVRDICAKNGYNLIYKPHPTMVNLGFDLDEIQGVDIVRDVNINSLIDNIDLCVTIVSQVSYISLIRDTAVLMLGHTQLKGKGCCYEAFRGKKLEKQLVKAIERGLTSRMKNKFVEHTARLLKYNLYDDMTIRELRFGRSVEDIDITIDA